MKYSDSYGFALWLQIPVLVVAGNHNEWVLKQVKITAVLSAGGIRKVGGRYVIIATQPYYKIERSVTAGNLETIIHQRSLCLYPDRIVSAYREFLIKEIYDISFRDLGQGHGVLYLHTKQGVFPYTLEADAELFISEVKRLIS